jgi:PAT family beta-lactamase induction signal transducer AmpG
LPNLTETRWLRLASFTAFYYAQGVPIGLLTIALPAWLAEHGSSLAQIASYQGIVGLPWGLKLIAGPLMDRFAFPPMGRRRPWVMGAQLGLTLSMASLALLPDAISQFALLTAIGFIVNMFAAVQDVAVDGMAIDVLPETERGRANALMAFGQVAGLQDLNFSLNCLCVWGQSCEHRFNIDDFLLARINSNNCCRQILRRQNHQQCRRRQRERQHGAEND